MKRNNLTAIIEKVILLSCDATLHGIKYGGTFSISAMRIRKAAVNEIIRLEAEDDQRKYNDGYNDGFECATIASGSIITAQERFDEIDTEASDNKPAPSGLDTSNAGAGLSPLQNVICGGVRI